MITERSDPVTDDNFASSEPSSPARRTDKAELS
ncbi:hypothetical protein CLV72_108340 [Allonocardiopsis opalescens]|uniref:Uncharacterized protein n=1 Tax=Allonocardiopsis opalescens TaxID=1144618 RepID=A0A2T0PXS1_9ACTN|nr:hypothetical protein CLV72_108340 [Allonocardiopsis opalescens]